MTITTRQVLVGVSLLALTACGGGGSGAGEHAAEGAHSVKRAAPAGPPVAVSVVSPQTVEWPEVREVIGTVRARTSGTVSARIMAYVKEVRAAVGDSVRPGQVLVVLESKELDTAKRQAEEALREARSGEAEVNSAIAGAQAQLDLAKVTFKRMQDLFEKKSISNQEYDEAQARLKLAESQVAMARAKKTQLEAKIAQAQEGVNQAQIQSTYTTVSAPFAGVVTEKRVEPGNLATPGAPLLIIEQFGSYRLEAPVDEGLLPSIKRGQVVPVHVEALGRTVDARVDEIVPSIDAATRTVVVKLNLPGVANLRSGMSGRARFATGRSEGLLVPQEAVRAEGSVQTVYLVEQDHARARMITTGATRDSQVQVLSGLTTADRIVHPLPEGLTDGQPIEVRK